MFAESARPTAIRLHRQAGWFAVATVCFGAFMGQLDASIVTLTFPTLSGEYQRSLAAVEWVSLSYLLTLVTLVAGAGRLSDALGRKRLYLWGFAIFTAASAACGMAAGLPWLIGFRVLQAVGAALLQANSVALVVSSVPRESMRKALGIQAAAQALGLGLGPVVGGLLVASLGWRAVFWVNIPIGIAAMIAGHYLLPRTRAFSPIGQFDWGGLSLLGASSAGLLLALSALSGLDLEAWMAGSFALASVGTAFWFVRHERSLSMPLVDLAVVSRGPVWKGLVRALTAYAVLFGPLVLFPQVLTLRGVNASTIGLVLVGLPAGFAVLALTGDRVVPSNWSVQRRLRVGASWTMAACVLLASASAAPPLTLAVMLLLVGAGLGLLMPASNAAVMSAIPPHSAAMGGGLVNMSRGLGTALGVALVTLALHLGQASSGALVASAALAGVAALGAWSTLGVTDDENMGLESGGMVEM